MLKEDMHVIPRDSKRRQNVCYTSSYLLWEMEFGKEDSFHLGDHLGQSPKNECCEVEMPNLFNGTKCERFR